MKCGKCDKTDGLRYTSLPPKVKCTVTGKLHNYDDDCDVGNIVLEEIDKTDMFKDVKTCDFDQAVHLIYQL